MSDTDVLSIERFGRVLRLTLDRPERHNALSEQLIVELLDAVEAAATDPETAVLVVRGAGRSFCAGYDIGGDGTSEDWTLQDRIHELSRINDRWRRLWRSPLPTIAQIHGNCLAGGTDLALSCDLVVAARDTRIGFPAVRSMGVPPTHMWLYHLGPQWTKRLMLTGDSLTGERAAELGLVLEAVDPADLDDHVMGLASRMAAVDRELLIGNKYVVNRGIDLMGREQLQDWGAVQDAIGHRSVAALGFWQAARDGGLREALRSRDAPFAQGDVIGVDAP